MSRNGDDHAAMPPDGSTDEMYEWIADEIVYQEQLIHNVVAPPVASWPPNVPSLPTAVTSAGLVTPPPPPVRKPRPPVAPPPLRLRVKQEPLVDQESVVKQEPVRQPQPPLTPPPMRLRTPQLVKSEPVVEQKNMDDPENDVRKKFEDHDDGGEDSVRSNSTLAMPVDDFHVDAEDRTPETDVDDDEAWCKYEDMEGHDEHKTTRGSGKPSSSLREECADRVNMRSRFATRRINVTQTVRKLSLKRDLPPWK